MKTEYRKHISKGAAFADCVISEKEENVSIELLVSKPCSGDGTVLLNMIKEMYPSYIIELKMMPIDYEREEKPSDDELEYAYELGLDFQSGVIDDSYGILSDEEKDKILNIYTRYTQYKKEDPFVRLFRFYRKNCFEPFFGGALWVSNPPHKLVE